MRMRAVMLVDLQETNACYEEGFKRSNSKVIKFESPHFRRH